MSTTKAKWVELSDKDIQWIKNKDKEMYAVFVQKAGGSYLSTLKAEVYPGKVEVRYVETGSVGHQYLEAKAAHDKMEADMKASGKPMDYNALFNGGTQSRYIEKRIAAQIKFLDVNSVSADMLPPDVAAATRLAEQPQANTSAYRSAPVQEKSAVTPIQPIQPKLAVVALAQPKLAPLYTEADALAYERAKASDSLLANVNQLKLEKRASDEISARLRDGSTIETVLEQVKKEIGLSILDYDYSQLLHGRLMLKELTGKIEQPGLSATTEFSH